MHANLMGAIGKGGASDDAVTVESLDHLDDGVRLLSLLRADAVSSVVFSAGSDSEIDFHAILVGPTVNQHVIGHERFVASKLVQYLALRLFGLCE